MTWPYPFQPRKWQAEALPIIADFLASETRNFGLLDVVMGAGKSVVMGATAHDWAGRVVITAPTKAVADQLGENLKVPVFHSGIGAEGRRRANFSRICVAVTASAAQLEPRPETLLLPDECHRCDTDTFREVIAALSPEKVLGFTATARKGTKGLGLFKEVLYSYRVIDALRDGVIVPWTIVNWTGPKISVDDAAREFAKIPGAPGLINAASIDDAEAFAATIPFADVVHSKMTRAEIQRRLAKIESGETQWMVHVSILAEGFDMPRLGRYIFRSNVGSPVSFAQQAGRVLRKYPGKKQAIFYDPLDLFEGLGLGVGALLSGGEEPAPQYDYDALLRSMGIEPPKVDEKKRKPKKRKAKALSMLQIYFRQVAVAVREANDRKEYPFGPWRKKKPSQGLIDTAIAVTPRLWRASLVPSAHLRALDRVWQCREHWNAGMTSDWIDTVKGLTRSGWTGEINKLVPSPAQLVRDLELLGVLR